MYDFQLRWQYDITRPICLSVINGLKKLKRQVSDNFTMGCPLNRAEHLKQYIITTTQ